MAQVETLQLKCPQCGAAISLHSKKTKAVGCSNCGSLFDAKTIQLLHSIENPQRYAPLGFLKLGLTGTIEGNVYQIIGRIRYRSTLREWDPEDSCYTVGDWTSDEWSLVGESGDMIFIYEDQDGYELCESFVPPLPGIPEEGDDFFSLHAGERYRIQEYGNASAVFFEGEFSWQPALGDRVLTAEYGRSGATYSVERRLNEAGETEEVEFFESKPISRLTLAETFGIREEIERLKREESRLREAKRMGKFFLVAAGILLFLSLAVGASGKRVFQETIPLSALNDDEGYLTQPFPLNKVGQVHNLQLKVDIPDNSEAWAAVELLEDDESPVNEFEGDFWRESGVDDEGSWSESDTVSNNYFRLEEPGQYQIRIIGSPGQTSGNVSVSVLEGITLSRFFLLAGFVSLLYGVGILWRKSLNPFLVAAGIILAFFFLVQKIREASDDDD